MQYCSQSASNANNIAPPKSSLEKYRSTVVGECSLFDFAIYELLTLLIMPLPGTIGIRMRQLAYRLLLQNIGRDTRLGKDITLRKPGQIAIGNGVQVGTGSVFDVKSATGSITVGDHVVIGEKSNVNCIAGALTIGEDSHIGTHVRLGSLQGLTIGRNCVIGDHVYLSGAAHAFHDPHLPIIKQPLTCRGQTIIGDHVVIGERTTISDGVHIGNHTTIAPDSFVNSNIPAQAHVSGVPATYFLDRKSGG